VFLAAQLRLKFLGLTQAQMLDIWNHYNGRRGEFRSFDLPTEIVSYGSTTDYVPGNYLWRYAGPGSIEDLPCGGHNVSLTLETVPPIAASVVGADLFLRLRLRAGAAASGKFAPGVNETITLAVDGGGAFVALNGINSEVVLALTLGVAIGDANVSGFNTGGVAFSIFTNISEESSGFDINGISETITLSLAAGEVSNANTEPSIGDAYGGGYFAGYISHTADGVATHRLIVAPAATGATGTGYTLTTSLRYRTTNTGQIASDFDGAANTATMVGIGISQFPAAEFCVGLNIGGFTDWYLPARLEYEIAYFNLKPSTSSNSTSWGINNYSVPARTANYTTSDPGRTSVTGFQSGQPEAFVADGHWSSTSNGTLSGWIIGFNSGGNGSLQKTSSSRVRAFRREAI
jgi:hypothetical protein